MKALRPILIENCYLYLSRAFSSCRVHVQDEDSHRRLESNNSAVIGLWANCNFFWMNLKEREPRSAI